MRLRSGPTVGASDRGAATVWAAASVAVLTAVLVAALDLGGATVARHRAEAAADLAALAAAGEAARGTEVACGRASAIAAQMGARVVLCQLRGWAALVEVEAGVRLGLLGPVPVRGRAHAGPAEIPASTPTFAIAPALHLNRRRTVGERSRTDSFTAGWRTTGSEARSAVHAARSPSTEHQSAMAAGMARPGGAYWELPNGDGSTGFAAEMSLPSLRWGRRVPRRPPRTDSTAPRPPPAGPAPDGPAGGGRRLGAAPGRPAAWPRRCPPPRRWTRTSAPAATGCAGRPGCEGARGVRRRAAPPLRPYPAGRCRCRTSATAHRRGNRSGTRSR